MNEESLCLRATLPFRGGLYEESIPLVSPKAWKGVTCAFVMSWLYRVRFGRARVRVNIVWAHIDECLSPLSCLK